MQDLEGAAGLDLQLDEVGGDEGVADREVDGLAARRVRLAREGEARPAAIVGERGGAGDAMLAEKRAQGARGVEDKGALAASVGGGVRGAGDRQRATLTIEEELDVGVEDVDVADPRTQGDDDAAAAEVVDEEEARAGDDGARDAVGVAVPLEVHACHGLAAQPGGRRGSVGGP